MYNFQIYLKKKFVKDKSRLREKAVMAGKNANVRNSLPRKYPLAIASTVLLHQKEREKKKGSWKAATSPGLESVR